MVGSLPQDYHTGRLVLPSHINIKMFLLDHKHKALIDLTIWKSDRGLALTLVDMDGMGTTLLIASLQALREKSIMGRKVTKATSHLRPEVEVYT